MADGGAVERKPVWVRFQTGESRAGLDHVKAFVHEEPERFGGPRVFVQVREFVVQLGVNSSDQYWCKWWTKHGRPTDWDRFLSMICADPGDWRPSKKQATARGLSDDAKRLCETEVVASPQVLVGLLLDWSLRLSPARRERSKHALEDVLSKVWHRMRIPIDLCAPPPFDPEECLGSRGGETCTHCRALLVECAGNQELTCEAFLLLLHKAWGMQHKCGLVREWAGELANQAGSVIEEGLAATQFWQQSAENVVATRGSCKRMRVDPDMAGATVAGLVRAKRFRSGRQVARSGVVDMHGRSIADSDENFMKRYWAAALRLWTGCRQLSISCDESTVGGEATMVSCLWDHARNVGAWLPVQVVLVPGGREGRESLV